MNVQAGSRVTFILEEVVYTGTVTYLEGGIATVMFIRDGLDEYLPLEVSSLTIL